MRFPPLSPYLAGNRKGGRIVSELKNWTRSGCHNPNGGRDAQLCYRASRRNVALRKAAVANERFLLDGACCSTGAIMGNVVNYFLLFSCMALFVTGIVVAAASLLI